MKDIIRTRITFKNGKTVTFYCSDLNLSLNAKDRKLSGLNWNLNENIDSGGIPFYINVDEITYIDTRLITGFFELIWLFLTKYSIGGIKQDED